MIFLLLLKSYYSYWEFKEECRQTPGERWSQMWNNSPFAFMPHSFEIRNWNQYKPKQLQCYAHRFSRHVHESGLPRGLLELNCSTWSKEKAALHLSLRCHVSQSLGSLPALIYWLRLSEMLSKKEMRDLKTNYWWYWRLVVHKRDKSWANPWMSFIV